MPFSDNGVDAFLLGYFDNLGLTGTACDVGANVEKGSNTLMLEQYGWVVLCVEPNPLLIDEGQRIRKLWRSVAAGAEDLEDQTFRAVGEWPFPSYSSLRDVAETRQGREIKVPVRRLDRILDEAGFTRLNLLCVDVEGSEVEVMMGFTLERWNPEIMVIESWNDDFPTPQGYRRLARMEYDNIYQRIADE